MRSMIDFTVILGIHYMSTLLGESVKGTFMFWRICHFMGPVFISSTNIFWFLIFTNKMVIEKIKIHETAVESYLN